MPARGEPNAVSETHVAVVRELVLVVHVAERFAWHPRVNSLEQVLLVDGRIDAILAPRDRHDAHALGRYLGSVASHLAELPAPDGLRIRIRACGRFEEAMWIEHELNWKNLGNVGRQRNRRRSSAVHVPRVSAVEHEGLMQVLLKRTILPTNSVLPSCRAEPWLSIELLLHRPVLPVHRPRVIGERVDAWPVSVAGGFPCLAERACVRRSGDRDAAKVVGADG